MHTLDVAAFVIAGLVAGGCVGLTQLLPSASRLGFFVPGQHPFRKSLHTLLFEVVDARSPAIVVMERVVVGVPVVFVIVVVVLHPLHVRSHLSA